MRWGLLVAMWAVVFAIAGIYVMLSRVDLSAVQQPGRTGEYLRTKLTRAVIRRRAAREACRTDRAGQIVVGRGPRDKAPDESARVKR